MAERLPYPGLRSFKREEADLFFGRDDDTDTMIARLMASRLLGVLGASGCGKSSLVRTALFEALDGGYSKAGSNWRIADCHPGGSPIRNLAEALAKAGRKPPDAGTADYIESELRRGPRSIALWCNEGNLGKHEKLLVLVDQFEELFTSSAAGARDEGDAFATLLVEASQASDAQIYVVVTMRSDYFGACGAHPALAAKIGEGIFLTPRMQRDQCEEAIEGPADVVGFRIQPALLNRILNDLNRFAAFEGGTLTKAGQTGRQADQLPLMQYALNQMWLAKSRDAQGNPRDPGEIELTLDDYKSIGAQEGAPDDVRVFGGLEGALDRQGKDLIGKLAKEGISEVKVEALFRALVRGPTLDLAVRDAKPVAVIAAISGVGEDEVGRIVEVFADPTCLFLRDDGREIDLSHESLIRRWSKLSGWFIAEAEAAETLSELNRAALYWATSNKSGDLLTERPLERREAFWAERRGNTEWIARFRKPGDPEPETVSRFVDESVRQRTRQRRKQQVLLSAALGAMVMVPVIGVIAIGATQVSRAQAKQAEQRAGLERAQEKEAQFRILAEKNKVIAAGNLAALMLQQQRAATERDALKQKLEASQKLAAAAQENARLAKKAEDSLRVARAANQSIRNSVETQYLNLAAGNLEAMSTPRLSLVKSVERFVEIAAQLPEEYGEERRKMIELKAEVHPYVIAAVGPLFNPASAAISLDEGANSISSPGPMSSLVADFLRNRAREWQGVDPAALTQEYKRLLGVAAKSAGGLEIYKEIHYRLAILALGGDDVVGSAKHLESCAEGGDLVGARCRMLLSVLAARDQNDTLMLSKEIQKRLQDASGSAQEEIYSADRLVETVLAVAALRQAGKQPKANSAQLEKLLRTAELFDQANAGTEESADIRALMEDVVNGPDEAFAARRRVLDAIPDGYTPTLDFLLASEPTLRALVPDEDDSDDEPAPGPGLLAIVPRKTELEMGAKNVARRASLLASYRALIDRTAPYLAVDSPIRTEREQSAQRIERAVQKEVGQLGKLFDAYEKFLDRFLKLKTRSDYSGMGRLELDMLSNVNAALYPARQGCKAINVPACAGLVETLDAFRKSTDDLSFAALIDDVAEISASDANEVPADDPVAPPERRPRLADAELNGLAIDWLAVGQPWIGNGFDFCRYDGKIYALAFPSKGVGSECGDDQNGGPLAARAMAEFGRLSEQDLRMVDFGAQTYTVRFETPTVGKTIRTETLLRYRVVEGSPVFAPAPGRIGRITFSKTSREPLVPPCRAAEMPLPVETDAKSGAKSLDGSPVGMISVLCHADGSYSILTVPGAAVIDSNIVPGRWVRRGESIGVVPKLPKGSPSQLSWPVRDHLSWSVRADGLYNWDDSQLNPSELLEGGDAARKAR